MSENDDSTLSLTLSNKIVINLDDDDGLVMENYVKDIIAANMINSQHKDGFMVNSNSVEDVTPLKSSTENNSL